MTKKQYDKLKSTGMFWEFYPECSGDYEKDKKIISERNKKFRKLQKQVEKCQTK